MNNNRSNRRRGRGNNRSQGGGNQLNRIDSRARGNAPQLLEKYKKLAHDASLNGDRVQSEYFLQFADHYFRVIADGRARQEEQRAKREEARNQNDGDSDEDDNDREDSRSENRDDASDDRRRGRGRRNRGASENSNDSAQDSDDDDSDSDDDDGTRYEPEDNPFTRRNPSRSRAAAPRARRSRKSADADDSESDAGEGQSAGNGLDTILPPSIGSADDGESKPAPRKRARRTRADEGGEPLEKTG